MEWPMTKLLKQPPLIKKATKELDRVIGRERWVEEKDIPQLPYIEAIVKETMRKHPVVGLLVPRLALEDCDDLLAGGVDTSVTIMEWPMTKLLKQPPLIKKATKELDRVIGRERWVEEKDIPQLPYIEAIVKETMRKHPVAGFLVPRLALEDCDGGECALATTMD
nr:cytochrome P450 76AD1-like [Quercus suber]